MNRTRYAVQRPGLAWVATAAAIVIALSGCTGGPSLQEQAIGEVRAKAAAARGRFEQALHSPLLVPGTTFPLQAKEAVGNDQVPVTVVVSSVQNGSGAVVVVAVVTARAEGTSSGYYAAYRARACVRFEGIPGPTAAATVSDVTCPEIRTAEPADETILVS
jgi:hypothetical protein